MQGYRARLINFYHKYNEEKVATADETLAKFAGKEDQMFEALVDKYGPEPRPPTYRDRLVAFYAKYNVDKLSSIQDTLKKFAGKEDQMFDALAEKYGEEPDPHPYRTRAVDFYLKYNRDKIATIDETLRKFAGRVEDMFTALVEKYGPEPRPPSPPPSPSGGAAQSPPKAAEQPAATNPHRERLVAFYQQYKPDKLSTVDSILEKFAGREDEMFEALKAKYVPAATSASSAPHPPASDYRARLVAFYEKHNPNKVTGVDEALKKWQGREEEMFQALANKYGGDTGSVASSNASRRASQASVSANSYRDRLAAFYRKYNSEKLATLDSTLEKFTGREEEMFAALVGKYGPEPDSDTASQKGTGSYAERLRAFYQKYNPGKMDSIDTTLQKYIGREEEMFQALVKKYGPEPTPAAHSTATPPAAAHPQAAQPVANAPSFRERLVKFYEKYNPGKLGSVDSSLQKYAGREAEMFDALVKKYGPEPTPAGGPAPVAVPTYRERLVAFYQKYNPDKVSTADSTLAKYVGREDELMDALVKKYGPEPAPPASTAPHAAQRTSDRLRAFYEKYNPSKVDTVDATLQKYVGREEELFDALVKKYGPEPSPPTPPPPPVPDAADNANASKQVDNAEPAKPQPTASPADLGDGVVTENIDHIAKRAADIEKTLLASAPNVEALIKELALRKAESEELRITVTKSQIALASTLQKSAAAAPATTPNRQEVTAHASPGTGVGAASPAELEELEASRRQRVVDLEGDDRDIMASQFAHSVTMTELRERVVSMCSTNALVTLRFYYSRWHRKASLKQASKRAAHRKTLPFYQQMQYSKVADRFYESIQAQRMKEELKRERQKEEEARLREMRVRESFSRGNFVKKNQETVHENASRTPGKLAVLSPSPLKGSLPREKSWRSDSTASMGSSVRRGPPLTNDFTALSPAAQKKVLNTLRAVGAPLPKAAGGAAANGALSPQGAERDLFPEPTQDEIRKVVEETLRSGGGTPRAGLTPRGGAQH